MVRFKQLDTISLRQFEPAWGWDSNQVSERTCLHHGYDTANFLRNSFADVIALVASP
jgi:hypothetical protein